MSDEKKLSHNRLMLKYTKWQKYVVASQKQKISEVFSGPKITSSEKAETRRLSEEYSSEKFKHLEQYPDQKEVDEGEEHIYKREGNDVKFFPATASPAVTGDAVTGDAVTGDTVTGDTVTGDTVTGDTVTGDTVTGDTVAGDTVAGDAPPATEEKLLYPEPVKVSCEITDDIWAESVAETLKATAQLFPDRASASDHPDGPQDRPSDEGNAVNWKLLAQRMNDRIAEMRGGDAPHPDPDNPVDTETGAPITGNAASPEEVSPTDQINTGELTPSASDSGATEPATGLPDIPANGSAMPYVPRKIQITATFDRPGSELSGAGTFEAQVTLEQINGVWELLKDPGDGTNLKIQLKNQVNGELLLLPLPVPKGEYILSVRENESSPNDVELPLLVRIGS